MVASKGKVRASSKANLKALRPGAAMQTVLNEIAEADSGVPDLLSFLIGTEVEFNDDTTGYEYGILEKVGPDAVIVKRNKGKHKRETVARLPDEVALSLDDVRKAMRNSKNASTEHPTTENAPTELRDATAWKSAKIRPGMLVYDDACNVPGVVVWQTKNLIVYEMANGEHQGQTADHLHAAPVGGLIDKMLPPQGWLCSAPSVGQDNPFERLARWGWELQLALDAAGVSSGLDSEQKSLVDAAEELVTAAFKILRELSNGFRTDEDCYRAPKGPLEIFSARLSGIAEAVAKLSGKTDIPGDSFKVICDGIRLAADNLFDLSFANRGKEKKAVSETK